MKKKKNKKLISTSVATVLQTRCCSMEDFFLPFLHDDQQRDNNRVYERLSSGKDIAPSTEEDYY